MNCLDYSTTNRNGNCAHDGTTKFGLSYSYGSAGSNDSLISGITDSVDSGRNATYTYDSLYRLTRAVTAGSTGYPAWGLSETYDRYGNRSAQGIYSGCTGITCPTNSVTVDATTNRITGSPYAYDLSGNMTNDGSNTLAYDAENHAVSATNGGGSGTYSYDGNGLRVKKVSGSTTTVYVFSGSKVVAEYVNGAAPSAPTREYIYSGAVLIAKIDSTGTKYYHQDHLSNRYVTDSSGNKVAEMGHFPYGEMWYNASGDKLLFTTYERDSESGNDYAQARYNVSRLGRFSSPDPIAGSASDPQSLNRYSYVRSTPVMYTDPSGGCPATVENRDDGPSKSSDSGGPSMPGDDAEPPEPQGGPCQGYLYGIYSGGFYLDGGFNGDDSGFGIGFPVGSSGGGIGGGSAGLIVTTSEVPNPAWFAGNCMEWDSDCGDISPWIEQVDIQAPDLGLPDWMANLPTTSPLGGPPKAPPPPKPDACDPFMIALFISIWNDTMRFPNMQREAGNRVDLGPLGFSSLPQNVLGPIVNPNSGVVPNARIPVVPGTTQAIVHSQPGSGNPSDADRRSPYPNFVVSLFAVWVTNPNNPTPAGDRQVRGNNWQQPCP